MADQLNFAPVRVLTSNAAPGAGYVAYFYLAGTTTPATVYTTSALDTAHGVSVTADSQGKFAQVFNDGTALKCIVKDATGATVDTIDPVPGVSASVSGAADVTFSPTAELPFTNVQDAIVGAAASAAAGFDIYGLGVTGSSALIANIDATNTASGSYRFDNTTTGTFPTQSAAVNTGIVEIWRETSGSAVMFLYDDTLNVSWWRKMSSSAWGTWRENLMINQGSTQGDILYRGASNWTRLAKGAAAQQLVMNAGATAPEWVTPASATNGLVFLSTQDFSATATGDFVLTAGYDAYQFILANVIPASTADLWVRTSTDGGSTFDSGASDYAWVQTLTEMDTTPTAASTGDDADAQFVVATGLLTAAGEDGLSGTLTVYGPHLLKRTIMSFDGAGFIGTAPEMVSSRGIRRSAADVDAVRFLFSTGAIESGTITLYGMKNA